MGSGQREAKKSPLECGLGNGDLDTVGCRALAWRCFPRGQFRWGIGRGMRFTRQNFLPGAVHGILLVRVLVNLGNQPFADVGDTTARIDRYMPGAFHCLHSNLWVMSPPYRLNQA